MQETVIGQERISVDELIGRGGEGKVYSIRGRPGQAVKIYDSDLRAKREDKVRAMVAEGIATKTDLVAYPIEVVSDHRGNFIGFAMRLVSGYRPLHELYSPKSRQRHFPNADYRFIVRAALNVARAVGKVHHTGCVIGDLNHSGVLVAQNATVAVIDADSFQFCSKGRMYPCVVGVPDFTPPELHGKDLATIERTIAHDNFGLAVAIFHLLFMGRHPYAGRHNGPDISMGDAIAQNRFAFSLTRQLSTQTTPPPGALTLDLFPKNIANAFEYSFGLNAHARPSASDWIGKLTNLEGSLNRCSTVKSHYYPRDAKACVWCSLANNSGFDMFPDISQVAPGISTNTRGTEQAIQEILAFRFPTVIDLLPRSSQKRKNSQALRGAKWRKRGRVFLGLITMTGAVAALIFAPEVWIIWVGLGYLGWSFVADSTVDVSPFLVAYKKADEQVQQELETFIRRNGLAEVVKVRSDLDTSITAYKGHNDRLQQELLKLKSTREGRQRTAYLDQFSIRRAKISGIGPAKKATLISFGIETAADVRHSAVRRVPGFGDVLTGKLMDWRRRHEVRFRYNPAPNAQDIADEKTLRARFAAEKAKLETTIRNGLVTLRNAKARLDILPAKARSEQSLLHAIEDREQAEQDLKTLGASIPVSAIKTSIIPPSQSTSHQSSTTNVYTTRPASTSAVSGVPSCPSCGARMVRRTAHRGRNTGNQFWGCSRFPRCRGTRNI